METKCPICQKIFTNLSIAAHVEICLQKSTSNEIKHTSSTSSSSPLLSKRIHKPSKTVLSSAMVVQEKRFDQHILDLTQSPLLTKTTNREENGNKRLKQDITGNKGSVIAPISSNGLGIAQGGNIEEFSKKYSERFHADMNELIEGMRQIERSIRSNPNRNKLKRYVLIQLQGNDMRVRLYFSLLFLLFIFSKTGCYLSSSDIYEHCLDPSIRRCCEQFLSEEERNADHWKQVNFDLRIGIRSEDMYTDFWMVK